MNIKVEPGANVQITDKPIVNVYGNVVGTQYVGYAPEGQPSSPKPDGAHEERKEERREERFHFVHPELDDDEAWHVHDAVKRVVAHQRLPEICAYLKELKQKGKVMLPSNSTLMYNELGRLGMPTGDGYSEKHFSNCYTK